MVATSLPRRVVGVALSLGEEHLLDFVVDAHEPCLGARGAIAKMRGLGLGFPHPVLRMPEVETKVYEQGPWPVCSLRSPCPRPSAARLRSCAPSHRLCYRYPVALWAQAQTGQWYLLCREHHTHSSHSLRPMMIGCCKGTIVSGAEPAKIGPCDDEDACCGGGITHERAQTMQARRGRGL